MRRILLALWLVAAFSGCASPRVDADHTLVRVEAVVVSYGEDRFTAHGENFAVLIDQKIPASHLEVRVPEGPFDHRLVVYSETPLPADHPFRQIGAVVEFLTERRFLVALLSDPAKPHDTAFLYVDHVTGLREKEPNQTPEPTRVDAQHADEALGPRGSS